MDEERKKETKHCCQEVSSSHPILLVPTRNGFRLKRWQRGCNQTKEKKKMGENKMKDRTIENNYFLGGYFF